MDELYVNQTTVARTRQLVLAIALYRSVHLEAKWKCCLCRELHLSLLSMLSCSCSWNNSRHSWPTLSWPILSQPAELLPA